MLANIALAVITPSVWILHSGKSNVILPKVASSFAFLNSSPDNFILLSEKVDVYISVPFLSIFAICFETSPLIVSLNIIPAPINTKIIGKINLPIISNNYFVELSEANEAIYEIIKELA